MEKSSAPFSSGGESIWNVILIRGSNTLFVKYTNNNGSSMHKLYCYWFIWKRGFTSDRIPFLIGLEWGRTFFHDSTVQ